MFSKDIDVAEIGIFTYILDISTGFGGFIIIKKIKISNIYISERDGISPGRALGGVGSGRDLAGYLDSNREKTKKK